MAATADEVLRRVKGLSPVVVMVAEQELSRRIVNSVACEGRDHVERCEVFGKWRARMRMAGFDSIPLSQVTIGYAAPEYGLGSKVSRSGDMYSFGILLLEMITNKKPIDAVFGDGLSLHNYAKTTMSDGVLEVVDPSLVNDNEKHDLKTGNMNNETCLRLLLEIGVTCSMESPQYRMDTASVIQELHLIKDGLLGNSTSYCQRLTCILII